MRQQLIVILAGILLVSCAQQGSKDGNRFEAYFSSPHCPDVEYSTAITQNNGETRTSKFGNAYCTDVDFNNPKNEKVIIDKPLRDIMYDQSFKLEQVDIASYFYYLDDFSQMLCERAKHDDFNVRFVVQHSAKRTPYDYAGKDTMRRLRQCLGKRLQVTEVGCDVFWGSCPKSAINTMHPKFIALRGTRDGKHLAAIFGGSGNIAEKLRTNFDNVTLMQVPQGSVLDIKHRCMVDVMVENGLHPWTLEKVKTKYEQCIQNTVTNDTDPEVNPYFLPAEHDQYLKRLMKSLYTATQIKAAVEILTDEKICAAMASAANHGAKIQLLTNSAWYLSGFLKGGEYYSAFANVEDVPAFTSECLKFYKTNAEIRFMETNSDLPDISGNALHLRYFITSGKNGSAVFTGSSHVKSAAFKKNYENQYIYTNKHLVEQYNENFDELWARSLPWQQMPSANELTAYAKEHQIIAKQADHNYTGDRP